MEEDETTERCIPPWVELEYAVGRTLNREIFDSQKQNLISAYANFGRSKCPSSLYPSLKILLWIAE
jgi:hypothetical protein